MEESLRHFSVPMSRVCSITANNAGLLFIQGPAGNSTSPLSRKALIGPAPSLSDGKYNVINEWVFS